MTYIRGLVVITTVMSYHEMPEQNCRRFADDIIKCISLIKTFCIFIKIPLNFVHKGFKGQNKAALLQIIPGRQKAPSYYLNPNGLVHCGNASICLIVLIIVTLWDHDDVIKWTYFPRYWPFVRGIHRSPVNSPHKGQWRGALMFLWSAPWINGWVNNREAGDLRRHRAHCDVIVMCIRNILEFICHLKMISIWRWVDDTCNDVYVMCSYSGKFHLSTNMSYLYRDSHYKDKTVSFLWWDSSYQERRALRRGPGSAYLRIDLTTHEISSHGIELVWAEYSCFSTRKLDTSLKI